MLSTLLFLLLVVVSDYSVSSSSFDGTIKSTGFMCSPSVMNLQCPRSDNLFVFIKTEDRVNRGECGGTGSDDNGSGEQQCSATRLADNDIQQACPFDFTKTGLTTCKFQLRDVTYSKQQQTTSLDSNCSSQFTANYRNIHYKCLPTPDVQTRPDVKYYDICASQGVSGFNETSGYIQTPGYPEYYGNNRDCGFTFRVPQRDEKLYIYLIRLSMEDNLYNDYVAVSNQEKRLGLVTGFRGYPSLIYVSNSSVSERIQLKFKSDWITTVALSRPKGMLVYFEYLNDSIAPTEQPVITTTQDTSTITTEESTSTSTTVESTTTEPISTTTETIVTTSISSTETTEVETTSTATSTSEPESSKIVEPTKKQDILIISSCLIALLAVLVLIVAVFAHKKRKVYDLFRINYKKAPITAGSGGGNSADNDEHDIIQTILVEDMDMENASATSPQATPRSRGDNYFNQKLRKLYQEMDKTMQLSKSMLSRRSTMRSTATESTLPRGDVESGGVISNTTANNNNNKSTSAVRIIYKGDDSTSTADSSSMHQQFTRHDDENECAIEHETEDSPNTTSSSSTHN